MARIAVFASGNGSNFQALAAYFRNNPENQIVLMICNKSDAFVFERAKNFGIPGIHVPWKKGHQQESESRILELLKEYQIDLILLAGFMRILSADFISQAGVPILNIHPSILPLYKGENAIKRAWEDKASKTGITIHHVSPEVDSGHILFQKEIVIEKNWPLDILEFEIHKLEHQYYPETAKKFCDEINRRKEKAR